jgi:hypothetical protein
MIEKRRYARISIEHDIFAAFNDECNRVGKVIDISLGGLSIEYIVGKNITNNYTKIDIFSLGNIFHLYNFPCNIVYDIDINVPYVDNRFVTILTTRRSGLKFYELSNDDFTTLKLFIENDSKIFSG